MSLKILLADDVEQLAEAIGEILKNNGYNVDIVFNGKDALYNAKSKSYDCIILDVMMPIMDGFEVVKQIRKLNIKTPVILLTAKSLVDDKVQGLDSGANDYLTKPFDKKELLARIRALTRIEEDNKVKYEIGNIIFNKENSQLSREKISLNLSKQECDIMEFFIKNPDREISEQELKERFFLSENDIESTIDNNIVPMYISYLQEKFSALSADIRINDVNGYKLDKLR